MHQARAVLVVCVAGLAACTGDRAGAAAAGRQIRIAHLGGAAEDEPPGFAGLRAAFVAANPGYDLSWHAAALALPAAPVTRIAFVQAGAARGALEAPAAASELAPGDLVVLRPGQSLRTEGPLDLLVFSVPAPPPEVPAFVRPDQDPEITDKPGGCATDPGAYRRLLLTWDAANGPYVFSALNAHRIRADDSFTHYHPEQGGFDEFYLVQDTAPGSVFLWGDCRALLEHPERVDRDRAGELLHRLAHPDLQKGDLIYIPRGVVHRGLGGIVAQIIAVPGFRPGGEVGVDEALARINERLGLTGDDRLPVHEPR